MSAFEMTSLHLLHATQNGAFISGFVAAREAAVRCDVT